MDDNTNSDVERALETFGGSSLKYRSFGTFALRPTPSSAASPVPAVDDEDAGVAGQLPAPPAFSPSAQPAAPLPAAPPAPPAAAAGHHADTLYPLLGAALPEASAVQVQPSGKRQAGAPVSPGPEPVVPPASYVPRQSRPATAYVPPTVPSPSVTPPGLTDPFPPPVAAVSVRPVLSTPVAERGWVPPPVAPEPMPARVATPPVVVAAPQPAPIAVPAIAPPAPEPAPAVPPPAVPAPAVIVVQPEAVLPTVAPARSTEPVGALAGYLAASDAPAKPEHVPANESGLSRSQAETADHRSLAEMFRVLAGSTEPARPPVAPFARPGHEEPGLFRRL